MSEANLLKELSQLTNPVTNQFFTRQEIISLKIEDDKIIIEVDDYGDVETNKLISRTLVRFLKLTLKFKYVKIILHQEEYKKNKQTKYIAIMSGKGGVGKSKVTVLLAKYLTSIGKKTGIIDTDIYGYSIPKILNLYGEPIIEEGLIKPLKTTDNIEVISTQYFIKDNENQALNWRIPIVNQMMDNLFKMVKWDDNIDYIIIDMPPTTGDIALNLHKYFEELDCYIVTTPNSDAAHVATRAGMLVQALGYNLKGVIENMSYYEHNDEKLYIFGQDGANEVAKQLNSIVKLQLPITNDEDELIKKFKNLGVE